MKPRLLLAALALLHATCRPAPANDPSPPPAAAPSAPPAAAPAPASASPEAPPVVTPADFVGAARCASCHETRHARWSRSWHARALSRPAADTVVGRFRPAVHFHGASSEAWMRTEGGRYLMRTRGPGGEVADFPIAWLIGGKRMQDTVAEMQDGALQVLPVYYHVTGKGEWVDYTETKQGALGPDHPFFWTNFRRNANHECLDCHTTGLHTTLENGRWKTQMADPGVACESCHGPGRRHAETESADDIFNPRRAAKEAPAIALALCASCHGPRQPLFPILDLGHRFQPGGRYDDHYQALVVVDGDRRSGDFFADGRPKTSSYEYQALLQSRCHRKGGVTCLTCHTAPHEPHADGEQRPERRGDLSCRGCHAAIAEAGGAHTRHRAQVSCLSCHMPKVVSGVLDHFADHAIDVPVPENTVRHGVPSACGVCHAKVAPERLKEDLQRLWPGAAARAGRRLRLADAIDEATAPQSKAALEALIADADEAPTLRGAAAVLLGQRFPRAVVAVRPLLRAGDALLRARAVEAVGHAGAREAAPALVERLTDADLMTRQMAALVLANFGDARGEEALRRLAREAPASALPRPHLMLGVLALRRGELALAERELGQAVALMPYLGEALLGLAQVHLRRGELERARERATQVLRFHPQDGRARTMLERLGPR